MGGSGAQLPFWENPQNLAKALAEAFSRLSCFLSSQVQPLAPAGIGGQQGPLTHGPVPLEPSLQGLGVRRGGGGSRWSGGVILFLAQSSFCGFIKGSRAQSLSKFTQPNLPRVWAAS